MKKNKKTKKNLKKFKKADFNYKKFIKKYYIEKGEAYISAKVTGIEDIISRYSTKGYEWINPEFASYVEENAYHIPVEESIVVEICGPDFSEEDQKTIETVIKDYFGAQLADKKVELDINKKRALALFTFALISFFIVYKALNMKLIDVVYEIPLVLLWFFLWELIDVVLLQRSKLYIHKLEAGQLASVKVKFLAYKNENLDEIKKENQEENN